MLTETLIFDAYHILNVLGITYQKTNNFTAAYNCYYDSYKGALKAGDDFSASNAAANLGCLFSVLGYYKKGSICFDETLNLIKEYARKKNITDIEKEKDKEFHLYVNFCIAYINKANCLLFEEEINTDVLKMINSIYLEIEKIISVIKMQSLRTYFELSKALYYSRIYDFKRALNLLKNVNLT